jgi:hypothetical protein
MTAAEVQETMRQHADESEEELTDDLYVAVKDALQRGERRDAVKIALETAYATFRMEGRRKERRAVGFVLAYLEGDCSPVAAL